MMIAQDRFLRKSLFLLFLIAHLIPSSAPDRDDSSVDHEDSHHDESHQDRERLQDQQEDLREQKRLKEEKQKREAKTDLPENMKMKPFQDQDPFSRSDIMLRMVVKPKTLECVHHLPKENFRVFFQLIDGPKFDASVMDPRKKELFHEQVKQFENGYINIDGNSGQPYELCVYNEDRWKQSTVAIEIGHPDRVAIKQNPSFDYLTAALQNELKEFRLRSAVLSVQRTRHTKKMERNLSYINYWSFAQTASMVTAGILQVVLIRSLFDEKSIVSKYFWPKKQTSI